MGNYLLSLRAPPPAPGEEEKNHPLYYDWTIPKWQPYREEPKSPAEEAPKVFSTGVASKEAEKKPAADTSEALKQRAQEQKERLTSTVDSKSKKPPNLDTHKPAKAGSGKSLKSSTAKSTSSIKMVDSSRPHTVAQKYSSMDDAAAIKAATNIHTAKSTKGTS